MPDGCVRDMRWAGAEAVCAADGVDNQSLGGAAYHCGSGGEVRKPDGDGPFYRYYQISGTDESDEAEAEPRSGGELKSRWEGSHSPFGFIWQVADATGWSVDYILNKVNYQTLIMMLSDAPRYRSCGNGRASRRTTGTTAEEEAREVEGFFRSNLRQ